MTEFEDMTEQELAEAQLFSMDITNDVDMSDDVVEVIDGSEEDDQ